jgi:hypothetical protein
VARPPTPSLGIDAAIRGSSVLQHMGKARATRKPAAFAEVTLGAAERGSRAPSSWRYGCGEGLSRGLSHSIHAPLPANQADCCLPTGRAPALARRMSLARRRRARIGLALQKVPEPVVRWPFDAVIAESRDALRRVVLRRYPSVIWVHRTCRHQRRLHHHCHFSAEGRRYF